MIDVWIDDNNRIVEISHGSKSIYTTLQMPFTISIYESEIDKKLDEKYIPDTIARKSDLQNIDLSSLETKEDAQAKLEAAVGYTHSNYYKKIMIDSKDKAINKKISNISKTITEQNIDTAFNDIFGGE
jgi:hypothetical protein